MRVNSTLKCPSLAASTRRSIYSGQDRLGDVEHRDAEFIARDRRGKPIGVFDTMLEAANAVAKAAGAP